MIDPDPVYITHNENAVTITFRTDEPRNEWVRLVLPLHAAEQAGEMILRHARQLEREMLAVVVRK